MYGIISTVKCNSSVDNEVFNVHLLRWDFHGCEYEDDSIVEYGTV
jgi:hypothetical protein